MKPLLLPATLAFMLLVPAAGVSGETIHIYVNAAPRGTQIVVTGYTKTDRFNSAYQRASYTFAVPAGTLRLCAHAEVLSEVKGPFSGEQRCFNTPFPSSIELRI
jgi:uncharacterized integral membrane protein